MNIVSAPFLFLFLPAVIGIYYLIPKKKDLRLRNLFLVLASLFFYAWGEPVYIVLLLAMILLTYLCGNMANGRKGTFRGKAAVAIAIISNASILFCFAKIKYFSGNGLPIGFSFFIFSSISYVVDNYRGVLKARGNILEAALYTSAFFRVLQGPIVSYHNFESQINSRQESLEKITKGIWRLSIGLCKKIIIADSLSYIVNDLLSQGLSNLTLFDGWFKCITYLVYLYFDFSGYTDMAIGMAEIFGFNIPENFNYPYVSASIAEFWQRFHITLCAWFTEYLYYPIMLGPSVKLRRFLQKRNIRASTAKSLQSIFVAASVWLVTTVWHGSNLNYIIWGFLNCAGMLISPHIKPFKNNHLNKAVHRALFLFFLLVTVPLISTGTFSDAMLVYRSMFSGALKVSDCSIFYIKNYGIYLIFGLLGCFPTLPAIKKLFVKTVPENNRFIWDIFGAIILFGLVIISVSFILTRDSVYFLYQW